MDGGGSWMKSQVCSIIKINKKRGPCYRERETVSRGHCVMAVKLVFLLTGARGKEPPPSPLYPGPCSGACRVWERAAQARVR